MYKSESNDIVLIDVAKFKPCPRKHHDSLAHLKAAARDAEIPDDVSPVLVSSSCHSADSLLTQDGDLVNRCDNDLLRHSKPDQQTTHSSLFSLSAAASGVCDDDDDVEDDDSCSVLQTDESMEAMSPSQDTDEEEDEALPAAAMAASDRSILCSLLWNNRPFHKSADPENPPDFVWSKMQSKRVNIWPSKPSTVKVLP